MTNNRNWRPRPATRQPRPTFDRRSLLAGIAGATAASCLARRSATAQAEATPAQGHSPISLPKPTAVGPEGLTALLACVPATMIDREDGSSLHWYYSDIAQQFDVLDLQHDERGPAIDDEPWVPATLALALGSGAYRYVLVEEFIDAIGFQPLGMNQTLLVGDPPSQLTLFRGDLDPDLLSAVWEVSGYSEESTSSGMAYWTIGTDGEFEFDHPIQRVVFAAFNNLAILGDETLVCAPTSALLEDAIATFQSGESSAALDPVLGLSLSTLPGTTVSAMALTPGPVEGPLNLDPEIQEAINETIEESDAAVGAMPPIDGMIVGVLAGAAPADFYEEQGITPDPEVGQGIAVARLVMVSAADAEQALAVAEHRWNSMNSVVTNDPYTEIMEIVSTSVDGNIAEIDFRQLRSPNTWLNMVVQRDLLPLQANESE